MDNNTEISFTITFRSNVETPIGEIINWLKSLQRKSAKQKVEQALIMAYLPYAKEQLKASPSEIERCFWETQDLLSKHGFFQSQVLKINQQNWRLGNDFSSSPVTNNFESAQDTKSFTESAKNSNLDLKNPNEDPEGENIYKQIDGIFGEK